MIKEKKLLLVGEKVNDVVVRFNLKDLERLVEEYPDFNQLRKAYDSLNQRMGGELPAKALPKGFIEKLQQDSAIDVSIIPGGNAGNAYEVGILISEHVGFNGWNVTLEEGLSLILQPREIGERFILSVGEARRITRNLGVLKELATAKLDESVEAIVPVGWHVLFYDRDWNYLQSVKYILKEIRKKALVVTDAGGFNAFSEKEIKGMADAIYFQVSILSANEYELDDLSKTLGFKSDDPVELIKNIIENSSATLFFYHEAERQIAVTTENYSTQKLKDALSFSSAAGCLRVETAKSPTLEQISRKLEEGTKTNWDFIEKKEDNFTIVQVPCFMPDQVTSSVGAGDIALMTFLIKLLDL